MRVIVDARPYANAVANQAKGGGYESISHYSDTSIHFLGIENIHVMRESLSRLLELLRANATQPYNTGVVTSTGDDFLLHLHQCGWLKHLRIVLEGAVVCAKYLKQGVSILVHCSDG